MSANRPVRSSTPRASSLGLALGLTLSFVLTSGSGRPARAQILMDPYNGVGLYQRQYMPYIYPMTPEPGSFFPNQGRLQERGTESPNQFRRDLADMEESDLGEPGYGSFNPRREGVSSRSSGPGVPYYRAYRQYDQRFQREYRPNYEADAGYLRDRDKQNEQYFRALREEDPKMRAKLLRQFSMERLQSSRQLSSGRTQAGKPRFDARATDSLEPLDDTEEPDLLPARPGARSIPRPRPSIRPEETPEAPLDRNRPLGERMRAPARGSPLGRSPFEPRPGALDDRGAATSRLPSSPLHTPRLPGGLPDSLGGPRSSSTTPRLTPRSSRTTPPRSSSSSRGIDDILQRARRARETAPATRAEPALPGRSED